MSQFLPHGFNSMHHAAMVGNTSLAKKLVEENPLLLFCVSTENYLPIHLALFTHQFETFGFLLKASQDHIDKCKLKENHSPFEGKHGAVLLNSVIDAGLIEVAYVLIKANDGIVTTKFENLKHALVKTVENFDLYSRQPNESRNLDQSLAKKLQLELRDTVYQGELSSRFESEPLSDEVQDFPESEVKDHKPLLLLRTLSNQLRKKYTLFNTRYIFMEAAVLSVRLDIEEALKELTLHFSETIMIKHEGQHLIEAAVSYGSKKVVNFWANKNYNTVFNLLDLQSDTDDNNVLHQAAMLAPCEEASKKSNAALRLQKEVMWFKNVESLLHPMYAEAKNKNGETPMMVFKREHEELRKYAEKLIIRKAKVKILVAMLIVVIVIAGFIKFLHDDKILTKTKMFFGMWGASIYFTAAIPLINSLSIIRLSIIRSGFRVEDFKHLPSNENYGMRMLLFSLASMMVACVTLFASGIWDGFGPVQSNKLQWVQSPTGAPECYPLLCRAQLQS